MEKLAAIVLMAGLSTRFGGSTAKQLCLLNDKPVFAYAIEAFAKLSNINKLVIAVNQENKQEIEKFLEKTGIKAQIVLGGITRQESVEHALDALNLSDNDIVIIHDAARPLVDVFHINQVAKAAHEFGASTTYLPAIDTIAIKNENNEVVEFINRNTVAQIQTPQAFKFGLLKKAHESAKDNEATDDCSLVMKLGYKVKLVQGDKKLHKITTKEDIEYLEGLLK